VGSSPESRDRGVQGARKYHLSSYLVLVSDFQILSKPGTTVPVGALPHPHGH
jgi:hypothetical protein